MNRVLIADDEPVARFMLEDLFIDWGYAVVLVTDGTSAWEILQRPDSPKLVLLDWQMPGLDGVEVCRRVRALPAAQPPYVILLTARQDKASIVLGLEAGANDYVSKPFDAEELHARVNVAIRMLDLQQTLADRIRELEEAQAHVKQLRGIIPICSYCKKVRNDQNFWQQVERYIGEHSDALFSHGICPDCLPMVLESARREMDAIQSSTAPG